MFHSKEILIRLVIFCLLFCGCSHALEVHQWQTESGVPVAFVESPSLPMLDVFIKIDAGSARDEKHLGLAKMTSALLDEGTKQYSADEFSAKLETLGVQYDINLGKDNVSIHFRTLVNNKQHEVLLRYISAMLGEPRFAQDRIEQVRKQLLVELAKQNKLPAHVASKAFFKALYGEHPYANVALGTKATLEKIDQKALENFHQKFYVQKNATITLVGQLSKIEAQKYAEGIVGLLPIGTQAKPIADIKDDLKSVQSTTPFDSTQAHIFVGLPVLAMNDPDYDTLTVANHVLGGSFTSRLFTQVRKEKGLAYAVTSNFFRLKQPGPFLINLQTKGENAKDSVVLIESIIKTYIEQGPTEEELKLAKNYLKGSFPLRLASNASIGEAVSTRLFYGLPMDYFNTYQMQIENVALVQVKEVLKRRLNPEKMSWIVVGGTHAKEKTKQSS